MLQRENCLIICVYYIKNNRKFAAQENAKDTNNYVLGFFFWG